MVFRVVDPPIHTFLLPRRVLMMVRLSFWAELSRLP